MTAPVVLRPKLALWMFERRLKPKDVSPELGVSSEQVRRICLPFGHPDRRVPDEDLIAHVHQMTAGAVGAADFYPAELRGGAEQAAPQ